MPPNEDIRSLIRQLTAATLAGRLEWRARNRFNFELGRDAGSVVLSCRDDDDSHPYIFSLYGADGSLVSENRTFLGDPYADWEDEIERLYQAVKSNGLGIQRLIADLTQELGLGD